MASSQNSEFSLLGLRSLCSRCLSNKGSALLGNARGKAESEISSSRLPRSPTPCALHYSSACYVALILLKAKKCLRILIWSSFVIKDYLRALKLFLVVCCYGRWQGWKWIETKERGQ